MSYLFISKAMKLSHLSLFILLLGSAFVQAREKDGARDDKAMDRQKPRKNHGELIQRGDKDGDGMLSFEEFSSMERVSQLPADKQQKLFSRLDKNDDGNIKAGELASGVHDAAKRRPQLALQQMDADKDGAVSFDEFARSPFVQKLPEDRRKAFFNRMDANNDGKLSPEDHRHRFANNDRRKPNGNGENANRQFDPKRLMERYDANKDEALSFEEFKKLPWIENRGEDAQEDQFERIDKNGDLKLTVDEFKGGPPNRKPGRSSETQG